MNIYPNPGLQRNFFSSGVNEALIRTMLHAAGKTWSLVHVPLDSVKVPSFRGAVFVPLAQQVRWLLDVARLAYPDLGASFSEETQCWTFPSGAEIRFGYLEHDGIDQHSGAEYEYVGVDCLQDVTVKEYYWMSSLLRSARAQPLRLRAACTGALPAWAMDRWELWVRPPSEEPEAQRWLAPPGAIRRFDYDGPFDAAGPWSRTFFGDVP